MRQSQSFSQTRADCFVFTRAHAEHSICVQHQIDCGAIQWSGRVARRKVAPALGKQRNQRVDLTLDKWHNVAKSQMPSSLTAFDLFACDDWTQEEKWVSFKKKLRCVCCRASKLCFLSSRASSARHRTNSVVSCCFVNANALLHWSICAWLADKRWSHDSSRDRNTRNSSLSHSLDWKDRFVALDCTRITNSHLHWWKRMSMQHSKQLKKSNKST